jgi:hypothetical protein
MEFAASFPSGRRGMQRKGSFVRYTADELSKLKSEADWAKVDATTTEEV